MLKKLSVKRNKKGFTLVELIVVIAILGILSAIAVPRLSGIRDNSAKKADIASATTIAKAAQLYVLDSETKDVDVAGTLKIEDLVTAGFLDSDPTPQHTKGGKTSFALNYTPAKDGDKEDFKVYYSKGAKGSNTVEDEATLLYPTN